MPKFKKNPNAMSSPYKMKGSPYKAAQGYSGTTSKPKKTKIQSFLSGLLGGFSKIGKDIQKGFKVAKGKRKTIPSIPKKSYQYKGLSAKEKIALRKRTKGY